MKKVTKIDKIQPSKVAKKKLRVAAYCRVSTDKEQQEHSFGTQKEMYTDMGQRAYENRLRIGQAMMVALFKAKGEKYEII